MPTTPTISSALQGLKAPSPVTSINWNAINVKPATATPSYSFSIPKAPAVPSLSTTTQTSTPMTSSPTANFSTATMPAVPSIGNLQSNDTAIKPGQFGAGPFATVNADGSSTPSAYSKMPAIPSTGTTQAPSQPSTYTPPSYAKTPSGATVDPATGSLVSSPSTASVAPAVPAFEAANTGNAASASSYSGSAGGAPGTYSGGSNPLITNTETEELFKKYLSSLSPSDQENADLENLNRLNTAAAQAYTDTQNQPIALPFITGQQAAIQRSQNLLTQPLQSELAYLQAKRQTSSSAAKAALDFSQSKIAAARDLATKTIDIPFGGSVAQYDAETGSFKPIFGTAAGTDSATVDSWVNLIKGGQAQLSDVPQQLRQSVAQGMTSSPTVSKANQDAIAQADTVMQKVDDILPMISSATTGVGAYLANVKGTPAYNLAAQLDTIKANVGFAALQAMRAASPTGGALGQVSEQENRLLQSTLASLDQGQSPEQLKENLAKVKLHFQNLKEILNAPINAQVSYDDAGNVVVTAASGGAFSSKSSQSGGSGSLYDW